MPSVGPFELTEVEFIGLEFLRQDDERQLRKTTLRATWSGRELRVRAEGLAAMITDAQRRDRFQGPAILENQLEDGTRKPGIIKLLPNYRSPWERIRTSVKE